MFMFQSYRESFVRSTSSLQEVGGTHDPRSIISGIRGPLPSPEYSRAMHPGTQHIAGICGNADGLEQGQVHMATMDQRT